jgi:uncharacterized membrane protein
MKKLFQFIRATITGGIIFIFPIVIIVVILKKAFEYLKIISQPFEPYLPELFMGFDGHNIFAIFLLIVLCFFLGMLFHSMRMQRGVNYLETNLLNYFPGYILFKTLLQERLNIEDQANLKPVLMAEGDGFRPGLLVEESEDGYCTVFFPDAPKCEAGEVRIVASSSIKKLNVPVHTITAVLRKMGKGSVGLISKAE